MGVPKNYIEKFINNKYNRLTILEESKNWILQRRVIAICECGVRKEFILSNIISGKSKSCGCLAIEKNTKHGLHQHPLYSVWEGMISRCYNKNYNKFHRYGGRGVTVCDEWRHDPKAFFDWAINKWEKGLTLDKDKLSPNGMGDIYSPLFCCFLTKKENSMYRKNSKVIEYNGEKKCISQWAEQFGIAYSIFQSRIRLGWTVERILSEPIKKSR